MNWKGKKAEKGLTRYRRDSTRNMEVLDVL